MPSRPPLKRPSLDELCRERYDLLIVGGGINGAGTAREAAGRGLKVLLVEERDFAFGASSRSTKLVHGGLRYLEHQAFGLVAESLRERRLLLSTLAPHLVRPLPFLFPVYHGDLRPPWMVRAGMFLYDALALTGQALIQRHQWLGPEAVLKAAPGLSAEGLRGAALYWDAQMDDARLCLENVLDARRLGARVLNACSLRSAHQLGEGEVRCRLRDEEAGVEREVRARLLVVCAGSWTDQVFRTLGREGAPKIKATKGVHLVTKPLTADKALLVPARSSKRVFFVIPWRLEGKPASLVGTTDTDFSGDPAHLRAEDDDLAWLIEESARVLPGARLRRSDIWATFAGLRPLTAPKDGAGSNSDLSREHVFHEEPGILAITGGKYTTYRALCQQLVEKAASRLGLPLGFAFTARSPLPGAPKDEAQAALLATLPRALSAEFGLDEAAAASLVEHLGVRARDAAALCVEDPDLKKPIAPGSGCPAPLALAAFSAEHEMVVHLEDFYLRRSSLGLLLPPDHRGVDRVASVIGERLWWTREREAEELEKLGRVVSGEYR